MDREKAHMDVNFLPDLCRCAKHTHMPTQSTEFLSQNLILDEKLTVQYVRKVCQCIL